MKVVQLDPQRLASLDVIEESLVGLCGLVFVGLRQVDQVRSVRDSVLCSIVIVVLASADEEVLDLICERWVVPFALRFEEEGEGVRADVYSICDCVLDT
jgi:hypothetical protein